MKMNDRTSQLQNALGAMAPKERVVESINLPKEDTVNRQGYKAYSLSDELRLISMLNTLKIQPQAYRTENEQMKELRDLIERIGLKDPYFVAQAIVYSRCMGEGMRSINHLAAALLAPFASGQEWSKRFYGAFDKKNQRGGCIFRLDDMTEIKDVFAALNPRETGKHKNKSLPAAMKKGFASVLEGADANILAKYKSTVIDIANLVHANSAESKATVTLNDTDFLAYKKAVEDRAKRNHVDAPVITSNVVKVLDAIMSGITVTADTWESANSEAGQIVAKAVKDGKISDDEAKKILSDAKADNWEALLKDGKLGILAALRNIRNILKNPRKDMINMWCKLITDENKVRKALILPMHFDLAYEVVMEEFARADYSSDVQSALLKGYTNAIPNLKDTLPGKTCVVVDCSGSMHVGVNVNGKRLNGTSYNSYYGYYGRTTQPLDHTCCAYKAGLIASTIAKATGADIIRFGSTAEYFEYPKNSNVFDLAHKIGQCNMGGTSLGTAFELMTRMHKAYDRIIVVSDNEINGRVTSTSYSKYIHDVCSPYVYACDMAVYGTTPLKNEGKVNYYFGYGPSFFEDIAAKEFNPNMHIDKVRKVVI